MTDNPTTPTTTPTPTDPTNSNTPPRPPEDHHTTNAPDHVWRSPERPPGPPQTTSEPEATIATATATRRGIRDHNCDAAAIHQLPGTRVVGAAVVDGIGSAAEIAATMRVCAEAAARVGARRRASIGILAAAELVAVPDAAATFPDGVAVAAVAAPGEPTAIAWTGDARAYGWDGTTLRQLTTDHTVGEWLRANSDGELDALASHHDNWVRSTLGRCSYATVHATGTDAPMVLLTSDGVHDQVPHDVLERLVAEHASAPQALADAIVAAPAPDEDGYRDDATVIVMMRESA